MGILSALLVLFFYYGFHQTLSLPPKGPHVWRQSDCASLAWHFYSTDANLFSPHIHNHILGNGKAVGEFPIVYWTVGMLYRIFGPHEAIFRLINILLLWIGLLALARGIHLAIGDKFWATVVPLLVFTSPVLVFYTNGFLPEPPALGLSFIGWYFFFRFIKDAQQKTFIWAMVFFTLAALVKVSTAINWIMVAGIFFMEWNGWAAFKQGAPIFAQSKLKYLPAFLVSILLIGGWYVYAYQYNVHNEMGYFRMEPVPVINASQADFYFIIYRFFTKMGEWAYYPFTHLVILFLAAVAFSGKGRKHPFFFTLSLLSFAGVLLYFCLFFQLFTVHDYFIMVMILFPLWVFIHGAQIISRDFPQVNRSWAFKGIVLAFLALNAYHAHWEVGSRYKNLAYHGSENPHFYDEGFKPWLEKIGVPEDALVISLPDNSPNNSLYLMDREGWTGYTARRIPIDIRDFQNRGAEFLILAGEDWIKREDIQETLGDSLGAFGDVYVYKLAPIPNTQ